MTNREKLHRLVDELSEAELGPTLRLVETQPWTEEDEAAVAEGRAEVGAGRTLSHEEMLRKHG